MKGQILIAALITALVLASGIASAKEEYLSSAMKLNKPFLSGAEKVTFDKPIARRFISYLEQNNPAQPPRYFGNAKDVSFGTGGFKAGALSKLRIGKKERAWTSLSSATLYDERVTPAKKALTEFPTTRYNTRYSHLTKQIAKKQ